MADWTDEETDEPLIADHRNFYKVEKWSRERIASQKLRRRSLKKLTEHQQSQK
jgi:hypothetical protein